jgi:hypothetical protein
MILQKSMVRCIMKWKATSDHSWEQNGWNLEIAKFSLGADPKLLHTNFSHWFNILNSLNHLGISTLRSPSSPYGLTPPRRRGLVELVDQFDQFRGNWSTSSTSTAGTRRPVRPIPRELVDQFDQFRGNWSTSSTKSLDFLIVFEGTGRTGRPVRPIPFICPKHLFHQFPRDWSTSSTNFLDFL